MTTYVLYAQDPDSDVEILAVSESFESLQAHAAELEKFTTDETDETLEWVHLDRDDSARTEFHGMDYWIVPASKI